MFTESLKQYLAELEETQVGGRSLSRMIIDVRSGKVELEFAETKDCDDGSRLERYEHHDAAKIKGWENDFLIWERKHHGRIVELDYRERVKKELKELLSSGFVIPDNELLNNAKLKRAAKLLEEWEIGQEYSEKLAMLCDLVTYKDGFFCFDNLDAINGYLNDNHHKLSGNDIDALLRFKTMIQLCWQRAHKDDGVAVLSESREKILNRILDLVVKGDWIAPVSTNDISLMMKTVLGVNKTLAGEDAQQSASLWKLLEQGKGDRVRVTMQNIIGYFISRKKLKEGSPAQNMKFFGDHEGYSNIDKGRKKTEMSKGFMDVLPLLDRYLPHKE